MNSTDSMDSSKDEPMYSPPDIDVDTAGRGQGPLEGMPGINVVRSIGQDEWDTYSNKTEHPSGGSD